MSNQQSPVAPESSKSEAVEESSSEAKPYTVEDGRKLLKDIQAQTGFDSYTAYLGAYMEREDRTDFQLLWDWVNKGNPLHTEDSFTIFDVSAHEDSPPKMAKRCRSSSILELLAALYQPREHVRVQVVVWKVGNYISRDVFDTLGLGLRIDPQFFLAMIDTLIHLKEWQHFGPVVESRPPRPSHVVVGRAFATFVHRYPLYKPVAAPIILIACNLYSDMTLRQLIDVRCVADQGINHPPPFAIPSHPLEDNKTQVEDRCDAEWLHVYRETFTTLAGSNPGIFSSTAAIIAGVLMPLLQMNGFKIRPQFFRLRQSFLALQAAMDRESGDRAARDRESGDHQAVNHKSSELHRKRFWLRRSVEDSDDDMIHFEKYISAEDPTYLLESSAYLKIKQEMSQIHNEARRLDAEVRDYLQLVVGNLALEESRKSIELSNQQILEGKRGL